MFKRINFNPIWLGSVGGIAGIVSFVKMVIDDMSVLSIALIAVAILFGIMCIAGLIKNNKELTAENEQLKLEISLSGTKPRERKPPVDTSKYPKV